MYNRKFFTQKGHFKVGDMEDMVVGKIFPYTLVMTKVPSGSPPAPPGGFNGHMCLSILPGIQCQSRIIPFLSNETIATDHFGGKFKFCSIIISYLLV